MDYPPLNMSDDSPLPSTEVTPESTAPSASADPLQLERFVQLYAASHARLHGFILTLLPQHDDAQEVLQETSLVLWRRFGDFDPSADFTRWACGIAFNIVRKFRRERMRERLFFSESLMRDIAQTRHEHADYLEERRQALSDCLQKLRDVDRRIIDAYYTQGITAVRIAEQTNRPVNTVYKALQRIRLALMQCVDHRLAAGGTP